MQIVYGTNLLCKIANAHVVCTVGYLSVCFYQVIYLISTSLNMNGSVKEAPGQNNAKPAQHRGGDSVSKVGAVKQTKLSRGASGGGQFRPVSGLYEEQLEEKLHGPPPRRTYVYPTARDAKALQQQQTDDNVEWNTSYRSCCSGV